MKHVFFSFTTYFDHIYGWKYNGNMRLHIQYHGLASAWVNGVRLVHWSPVDLHLVVSWSPVNLCPVVPMDFFQLCVRYSGPVW